MTSDITPAWSELNLSPEMLELIAQAGYTIPSPVQAKAIPFVMDGRDVLVSSQTGSGKTASFVIPVVERFKNKNGTYILALSPTREIAQQTGAVFESFGAPFGLRTVVCIGGASIPQEKEALASSPHIIVATPGRLCDHMERGNVWLDFIQCLIFDEADRMLDMGFSKQIEQISEQIPKERQTLMFSATFAPKVERLARNTMNNPEQITIEKAEGSVPKIEQHLVWVEEEKKASALMNLIRNEPGTIIVFAKSKERVYQVWRTLEGKRFKDATYMHSDCTQEQREAAVADFKSGRYRVLVATDVMGRGIDVDDVAHVVNYDVPREPEDYVHRIGRTGRRGKTGMATTFAIPFKDEQGIKAIAKVRGVAAPDLPSQNQNQNQDQERDQGRGPRDNRGPRDSRGPRGDSRDSRVDSRGPRGPRDQNQNSRPPRQHTEDKKPNNPVAQAAAPVAAVSKTTPAPVMEKKTGFMSWVKKLFN
ncbi:MAG TPA: DEAD/DEAH box helicase [Bacteriovoracaceae bacterium]|nr:DEAD/DEAH box helicase [Bacteriovoracaceae bacterium]